MQLLSNSPSSSPELPTSRDHTRNSPDVNNQRKREKSWFRHTRLVHSGTRKLLAALISLIVTWSPIFIVLQLFVFCRVQCRMETLYPLFLFGSVLFHLKGFIHPIFYTMREKTFSDALERLCNRMKMKFKRKCPLVTAAEVSHS